MVVKIFLQCSIISCVLWEHLLNGQDVLSVDLLLTDVTPFFPLVSLEERKVKFACNDKLFPGFLDWGVIGVN